MGGAKFGADVDDSFDLSKNCFSGGSYVLAAESCLADLVYFVSHLTDQQQDLLARQHLSLLNLFGLSSYQSYTYLLNLVGNSSLLIYIDF